MRSLCAALATVAVAGSSSPGPGANAEPAPADATAAVFTLTGVQPTASTFVTAFPHGQSRPVVSNLNLRAGETRANLVTVKVGADRKVGLYNHNGALDLESTSPASTPRRSGRCSRR